MVETVEIPLSWANNIPGVSGVEDAQFDVPQVPDIEDAVDNLTPDLDAIGQRIDDVTLDIADVQDRLDDLLDGIEVAVDNVTVDLGDVADDVRDEVDEALADIDLDIPGSVGDLLEDIDQDVSGLVADVEQLDDRIVEQLPDSVAGQPLVEFESVFGALRNDIVAGLTEAINSLLDEDGAGIPTINEIASAVTDGLEDALADLPGGDLLLAPDEFVDDQIDRLLDLQASEETRQALQAAAEEE